MRTFIEKYNVVQGAQPQTTNTAVNSKYVSLKNAIVAFVVVQLTQAVGHATQISLFQAKDVGGTGAVALASAVPVWANEDAVATDQFARKTDGISYAVTNDVKNKTVVFQIEPSKLDINNGFTSIQARIGASAQATNFASIEILVDNKYEQATLPSVLVN
ncbi:hypothetical protein V7152_14940 [Neobacillus drentensis]|uniref:hypothetical protein n=1 Tax=Neobacillus drentensis TaxID=220684 RepID=UPI0030008568